MPRTCGQCSAPFQITDADLAFYEKVSPSFDGKKELIPPPTLCPDCRSIARCVHRNERSLHRRICSLCSKSIVSVYAADAVFPVYCQACFFSDSWNPLDFGQAYEAGKPFFEQLKPVLNRCPQLSIINKQTDNSEYSNYSFANKNCYLTFGSHYEEDCLYGAYSTKNRDCLDCLWLYGSELLYECNFSKNCYHSLFLDRCEDSRDCAFSRDLKGCSDCLFCANLHQKKFHIFNEPFNEEEYRAKLQAYRLETWGGLTEANRIFLEEMPKHFPVRALVQVQCEKCDGDTLTNCKGMRQCFICADSEDCAYGIQIDNTTNALDTDYMGYDRSEYCHQLIGCQGLNDCLCCNACWHGSGLKYCQSCFSSHDCFGCMSLQQKKHCILNKEYSKDEYERLAGLIAAELSQNRELGMFFPVSLSPFAYNETIAMDWRHMQKEEVLGNGYRWHEDEPLPDVEKIINAGDLPETAAEVPDDVLNWAIRCIDTNRPFKIVRKELDFYRSMNIPLPRRHPDERHRRRILRRPGRKLWNRECAKCGKGIATSYAPERAEKVVCEECYLKEVY